MEIDENLILREMRSYDMDVIEVRADERAKKTIIGGHAAVFNQLSEDLGGFREQIAPGAFRQSILEDDVRALWNHNADHVLGRSKLGTLRLWEDEAGLAFEIDPPDTQAGRDLTELIRRGDVYQMSFGFRTVADSWSNADAGPIRTLLGAKLFDVSPVTFPAYPQTSAELKKRAMEFAADQGQAPEETDNHQAQARLELKKKRTDLAGKF